MMSNFSLLSLEIYNNTLNYRIIFNVYVFIVLSFIYLRKVLNSDYRFHFSGHTLVNEY